MSRKVWTGLETKAELDAYFAGEAEEIMGDLSTTARQKVMEISIELYELNAKKALLPAEPPREIIQEHYTINLEKVEPLLAFPLVELSPECKKCRCFTCSRLFGCTICSSNTLESCLKVCRGIVAIEHCEECEPWTAELILRNEE